jgi:RimJ/RimL family protein N-acetyltransferase
MEPFAIATARLALRPFRPGDVDDVFASAHDEDVGRYVPSLPFPYERADAEAFLALAVDTDWTRAPYLAIVLDGRVIGGGDAGG